MDAEASVREELFKSLRESGAVDSLKASLRAQVIDRLRERRPLFTSSPRLTVPFLDTPEQHSSVSAEENNRDHILLEWKILTSLVADFLEKAQCLYTLSVFIPEGGLESTGPLSRQELRGLLGLAEKENRKRKNGNVQSLESTAKGKENQDCTGSNNNKPLLLHLLCNRRTGGFHLLDKQENHVRTKDSETQTMADDRFEGDTAAVVLQRKLNLVADTYSVLTEREALVPQRSIEERMLRYQRECDRRAESWIQDEVARFRETELTNMRMQERAMYRRELNKEKEQLQQAFRTKLNEMAKRERVLHEQVSRKEAELQQQLYEERQALLAKLQGITSRAENDRQKYEIDKRSLEKSMRQVERKEVELEKSKLDMSRLETELRLKYEEQTRTYRQQVLADFVERERKVRVEEVRLQEVGESLTRQKRDVAGKLEAAEALASKLESLQEALNQMRVEKEQLGLKVQTFNDQIAFVKDAAQHDRDRYDKLYADYVSLQKEAEDLRRQQEASTGFVKFREQEKKLIQAKKEALEKQQEMEQRIRQLESEYKELERDYEFDVRRFEEKLVKANTLFRQQTADVRDRLAYVEQELESKTRESEEATALARSLEEENVELRRLLAQTRKALTKELDSPTKQAPSPPAPAAPPQPPPPPSHHSYSQHHFPFSFGYNPFPTPSFPSFPNFQHQQQQQQQQMETINALQQQLMAMMATSTPIPRSSSPTTEPAPATAASISSAPRSPSPPASISQETFTDSVLQSPIKEDRESIGQANSQGQSPERETETKEVSLGKDEDAPLESPQGRLEPKSPTMPTRPKSPASPQEGNNNNNNEEEEQEEESPLELGQLDSRSTIKADEDGGMNLSEDPVSSPKQPKAMEQSPGLLPQQAKEEKAETQEKQDVEHHASEQVDAQQEALKVLQKQREAQEKQRRLLAQQAKEKQRRILEAEKKQREEEARREKERQEEEARRAREAEAAAKAKQEEEERALREEEERKKRENDAIIQQYREKAMAKLAQERGTTSQTNEGDAGTEGTRSVASSKASPKSALSPMSAMGSVSSTVSGSGASGHGSGDADSDSDGWTF